MALQQLAPLRGVPVLVLASLVVQWALLSGFSFPQYMLLARLGAALNLDREEAEQAYLWAHMKANDAVLSIGGNVGTTCIFVDKLASDPSRSVCVEPNSVTQKQLEQNKKHFDSKFEILGAILSRPAGPDIGFVDNGIMAHVAALGETPEFMVKQVDRDLSGFNVLVIDCEGCFCNFVKEFPEVLENARVIINEYDGLCDYDFDAYLYERGLPRIDGSLLTFGAYHPRHDVYSREMFAGRRAFWSHGVQLALTVRKKVKRWTGLTIPFLLAEFLIVLPSVGLGAAASRHVLLKWRPK